ncbi:Rib/alpha-like domain-containing protein [Lactobacillus rodentium]|nr:Rib/alpha-like domain-containing protein [Lactobacillus rodentium]MCR1894970.1 Rib/alpha-like domain-containing protein [Lactobacillus rodentium]
MLSKRNYQERLRQMEQKTERFSIRKLTIGAASVLIGLSFLGFNAHTAHAATSEGAKTEKVETTEGANGTSLAANSSAAQPATEKASSAASSAATPASSSAKVASSAVASSAAKSETVKPVSLATSSVASSAAKDDNVITSNGNGVVTGKNAQGTWAAKDATTPAAAETNSQDVTDWSSFINALEDANVGNINLTHDITVTGKTGSLGGQSLGYNGCLTFKKENVARKVTITGNGNTVDFGHYSLMFQDANQKNGNGWDITIDDTKLKGVSKDGSGQTSATEPGQFGLISFADVNSDNQKKDTVTFNNVTANAEGRSVITGAGLNHSGEYYTLVLTGDNDVTASEDLKFQGTSGSALDAGYVRVDNGTTSINVTSAYDGSNNYGGNAIRTAQTDIHNNDGSTVYSFDIKKGATLNIKGGANARGIFAVDGVHGTANIDGTVKMDLGTGHSMAVFAGNLNVGKDGVLDVTTAYDATPDFGQIARSISNFNGGQYGVLSIGVGNPTNLTNVDSNTINDNGIIRVKRTSTNEGMNPIISMGSGSSAVLKGTFTINVNQGATLDLQDSRQQTNLGMIFVSGSSANSNINIVNPKYVNLQRLNTPLPKNGSDLIYLEGGGQGGRTNGVHISNAPIAEWQAANTSTAPNFTWMVQSVNSMNNWGTNAGSGFTVAGQTSPQNKDGQEKFLYSNGNVIMAPSQSGTNSFEYNGSQKVNKNSNQGIITQGSGSVNYYTPYLNQFLNNYSYWNPQRLAIGSSLLTPDSPVKSHDNDLYEPEVQTINGTTKQTLNDLDANKGIKDLQKASMDENGNWTTTTVPVDGIVKNVAWYTSGDATEWANTMGGENTPTNPEGNLKTTDTSAWAKVTYEDGSIDFVKIPLNITEPHDTDVINPTDPTDPSQKDLFTTVTRTIEVTNPETGKTTSTPQSVTFARTKTIDKVTGETVSYGEYKVWDGTKQTDKTTGSFAEYDIPQIKDYTSLVNGSAATNVAANNNVTPETKSSTIKVTYSNEADVINPTDPTDPSQKDLFTTVTRTIEVTNPETGKTTSIPQSVTFARTKTVNKKTGEVMGYGEYKVWNGTKQTDKTTGSFAEYDIPQIKDYTSLVDDKAATEVAANNNVTPETKPSTVKVSYTAKGKTPDTDTTKANGGNITVDKGHKLNDGDAEDAITNHTKLPEGTKYTWEDAPDTDTVGDKNGIVTVTYPNGSKEEVPVMVHVTDDADKYDPQGSTITIKKGAPVPNAEKGIENPSELPTGTKYTWDVAPDPEKVGNQPVIVTVTYPDGSIDKVPATVIVTDDNNGNPTTPSDADKYDPQGQVVTVNKGDKLPDASNGIANTSDLPEGTKYSWKTPVDTTTSGDKPAIVVVTYPDGSSEDVPTIVHVNPTDADKYTPEGHNITVDKGSKVPDAETAITNTKDLPEGTKYTWKDTPDTNTIGDHPAIVVVTYPDGSVDEVPVIITVKDPNNKPANPTDADKYNPEGGTIIAKIGDDLSNDAVEGIVNKDELHNVTKYSWTDGTPSTAKPGLTLHDITVTYQDGSKDIVPAYVNVVSDADKYTPVPEVVDTNKGQVPDPSKGIANKGDLPKGTKYSWKGNPDVNTIGDHPAVVIVTYPDGSQDEVPTIIHVTDNNNGGNTNTGEPTVTNPTDADIYTPEGQDIPTKEGQVPDPSQGISNKDQLPGDTTYTWQDPGKVAGDVKHPGSHPEIIVVHYPDGSTDTVTVNVNVPTPEPKPIDTPQGVVPDPSKGIKNPDDMPDGTKYQWTNGTPDVSTPGTHEVTITVIYPDGTTDTITTTITVAPHATNNNNHGKTRNINEGAGVHSGDWYDENGHVHASGLYDEYGNGVHSSFYGNGNSDGNDGQKTLPQTGAQANMAGVLGLMIASVGAILGLAADKKRKN